MDVCQPGFRSPSSPQTAFHGFEFQDVDNDGDTNVTAADHAPAGKTPAGQPQDSLGKSVTEGIKDLLGGKKKQ